MKSVLCCGFVFLFFVLAPVGADAQYSLEYLGPLDGTVDLSQYAAGNGEFTAGNRVPVASYFDSGYDEGFSTYPQCHIVAFCPGTMDIPCSGGWKIDAVHFVFASLAQVPTTIDLRFDIAEGYPISDPGGMFDGLVTPWTEGVDPILPGVLVPGEGYYQLTVVTPGWDCMFPDYYYGISQSAWISGSSQDAALFRYAISSTPNTECPSLSSWTMGEWIFIESTEYGGDLVMWVDASCCEDPVSIINLKWDAVKALYR